MVQRWGGDWTVLSFKYLVPINCLPILVVLHLDKYTVFIQTLDLKYSILFSQEKEQKYQLRLEGCKLRDLEGGWLARKAAFAIFNPDHKYVIVIYDIE